MRLLLDTHILLWTVAESRRISADGRALIGDLDHQLVFSVVSIWEVAVKTSRGHGDFAVDAARLFRRLLDNGYADLPVTGAHAAAVASLPPIHKDPFDRMLVAQATVERLTLVTADPVVAKYPCSVRRV